MGSIPTFTLLFFCLSTYFIEVKILFPVKVIQKLIFTSKSACSRKALRRILINLCQRTTFTIRKFKKMGKWRLESNRWIMERWNQWYSYLSEKKEFWETAGPLYPRRLKRAITWTDGRDVCIFLVFHLYIYKSTKKTWREYTWEELTFCFKSAIGGFLW